MVLDLLDLNSLVQGSAELVSVMALARLSLEGPCAGNGVRDTASGNAHTIMGNAASFCVCLSPLNEVELSAPSGSLESGVASS